MLSSFTNGVATNPHESLPSSSNQRHPSAIPTPEAGTHLHTSPNDVNFPQRELASPRLLQPRTLTSERGEAPRTAGIVDDGDEVFLRGFAGSAATSRPRIAVALNSGDEVFLGGFDPSTFELPSSNAAALAHTDSSIASPSRSQVPTLSTFLVESSQNAAATSEQRWNQVRYSHTTRSSHSYPHTPPSRDQLRSRRNQNRSIMAIGFPESEEPALREWLSGLRLRNRARYDYVMDAGEISTYGGSPGYQSYLRYLRYLGYSQSLIYNAAGGDAARSSNGSGALRRSGGRSREMILEETREIVSNRANREYEEEASMRYGVLETSLFGNHHHNLELRGGLLDRGRGSRDYD